MRVFVTGASGFIGTAIVKELLAAGHTVTGLARSDVSAAALVAAGAAVLRGDLTDVQVLRDAADASEGVIHAGFIHDFANFMKSCEIDKLAIEAMGAALVGTGRPLVVTSGLLGLALGPDGLSTEETPHSPAFPRASESTGLAFASQGVRVSVIRLPPSVHGDGDHGFLPSLIHIAREKGAAAYVGDGLNRWSAVHRDDAAHLFRLALEKGEGVYHGVGDEGVPTRDIAGVIGAHLSLPVVSKSPEEAAGHFGWMARFFALEGASSSALTRTRLGWAPTRLSLLADLEGGTYFKAAA